MAITPKDHFKPHLFVDRKVCFHNFEEAVYNIGSKEFSVLVYYGVAGIGKTSLRKEFIKYLEDYNKKNRQQDVTWSSIQQQEVIWTSIDLQLEKHREKNTFLVTLKNDLQEKFEINFPAFEIAHAIYWKKANPEIPLRKDNYLLFNSNNVSDNVFGIVSQIPYLGIVPYVGRLLIKDLPDYLRKWWTKKGKAELQQLSEKEPLEIEEMLPYFWAQDLKNYLKDSSKIAVLFIDTYEALWENHRDEGNTRDEWIREELVTRLPRNVLWIICGRESLRWEETDNEWNKYLTQHKVEELFRKYCVEYLKIREITDKEIQEVIFNGSKGVPYYLELSADTYVKIVKNGDKPKPENFGDNHQEIANRFFRYLSSEEKNSLNILSIPRFWDYNLFKYLIKEFNTGYSTINYEDLCSFSFIKKVENNKQRMHLLMQDCLQRTQVKKKPDSVKRTHKAIHDYYGSKLDNIDIKAITREHETALIESFYHAKESLEAEDLFNWFIAASDPFYRAAFWQLVTPMYEETMQILEKKLGPKHPDVATTLNNLAGLYKSEGNYEKALLFYQRALCIRENVLGLEHLEVATTLNELSMLYRRMGDYKKALPLCQRALDIREKVLGPQHPDVAVPLNNLALLYLHMGAYEKALPLYQRALEMNERMQGQQHLRVAMTLNELAMLYRRIGDYKKALPLCQRALDIREKVLGPQHPDVATVLSNLALLHCQIGDYEKALPLYQRALEIYEKVLGHRHHFVATTLNNLAELYESMKEYEKALSLYQRSLEISEKVLGQQHPEVATTINNLALLYTKIGNYEKALPLYQRALDILEKALGPEHPEVATTLDNLAGLYESMGDYKKALLLYRRVLCTLEKVLGSQHPYVATTLDNLAGLYESMGDYEKALPLYQRTLDIREKVLGLGHPDVEMTLNNISRLHHQMGDSKNTNVL